MSYWDNHPFWKQWGDLTSYYNALDVACDWFSAIWSLVPIENIDQTTILRTKGISEFRKDTPVFKQLLEDRRPLTRMVFLTSFALTESFCKDVFRELEQRNLISQADDQMKGGIESWSQRLLTALGRSWDDIQHGKAGILETAIIRNCYTHSSTTFSQDDVNRFTNINLSAPWNAGDSVPTETIHALELRHRLHYFANIIRQGANAKIPIN